MFKWIAKINLLELRLNGLSNLAGNTDKKLYDHIRQCIKIVECETCGCLLNKETAIRGKSKIEERKYFGCMGELVDGEYIKEVYYCKIHAPGNKTK